VTVPVAEATRTEVGDSTVVVGVVLVITQSLLTETFQVQLTVSVPSEIRMSMVLGPSWPEEGVNRARLEDGPLKVLSIGAVTEMPLRRQENSSGSLLASVPFAVRLAVLPGLRFSPVAAGTWATHSGSVFLKIFQLTVTAPEVASTVLRPGIISTGSRINDTPEEVTGLPLSLNWTSHPAAEVPTRRVERLPAAPETLTSYSAPGAAGSGT
jgi:hypothetical protein